MKSLIENLPNFSFSKPSWTYLNNITLADPEFNISRPVDPPLGADVYSLILLEGICRLNDNIPITQNTRLGWILIGNVKTLQCNLIINDLKEIQKFWEMEDISEESTLALDDQQCIDYYKSATIRREDGRYEVRLPLDPDFSDKLGESKSKAIAQFKSLENIFKKHENIKNQYQSFINEYRALGHMIAATGKPTQGRRHCVLTHHCVRADDTIMNSKFRVVFNASCKTSWGNSLNDVMKCGPNLQEDLQSLIIKYRQYQFAFTADIEKMSRQIWIHPDDQQLLRIVWRDSPSEPIKDYQLTTVTYGMKAAPFLAMMTLKQLACDE
ncbi:unnamed protein product [Parnassius mnemosyne]|uniref:Peptidase aspartic putative domain-containing protein n=1 Tax=Parnassius mnemosyne TaxID=213953 RepID=A0AAV1L9F2_9NEOP